MTKQKSNVANGNGWFGRVARTSMALAVLCAVSTCVGCASAKIDSIQRTNVEVERPDFVLVHDLAVTPDEIKMDKSLSAQAIKELSSQTQTEAEAKLGHAVAAAMTDALVADLRKAGIPAAKAGPDVKPTDKTLVITGKFLQVDQGNQMVRVLLGFGMGGGHVRAQFEGTQGGRLIAKAQIVTSGSMKPGLLVPVAGGAAAGTYVTSSAVAAGTTGVSEGFMATVAADAQRAAKVAAKKIVQGYINHGWATPEDLKKLDSFF